MDAGPAKRFKAAVLGVLASSPLGRRLLDGYRAARRLTLLNYGDWLRRFGDPPSSAIPGILRAVRDDAAGLSFSIVVDSAGGDVAATLAALNEQSLGGWDLVIVGAGPGRSAQPAHARVVPADDPLALNLALGAAGDWIVRLSAGDRLAPNGLAAMARAALANPGCAIIYADHDHVSTLGKRHAPVFKPAFDPDLLLSRDYMSGPLSMRREAVLAVGGYRYPPGSGGDHDLLLRLAAAEYAPPVHLPFILCSREGGRRPGLDPSIATQLVGDALAARGLDPVVSGVDASGNVRWRVGLGDPPMVSVIIPTRDRVELLRVCLGAVLDRTDYPRLEVIVVDNGSSDPATLDFLEALRSAGRVRLVRDDGPFNFSRLNNIAAAVANGRFLCLMNNDVEPVSPDWLRVMVGHGMRPGIGAVGCLLRYPDRSVQHAGVVIGMGGLAGHVHKGVRAEAFSRHPDLGATRRALAVTAACMLTPRDTYLELGGLDEQEFAVAFNDVDYCLRLARAGHAVVWTPEADLIHHESASRGSDLTAANRERFQRESDAFRRRWCEFLDRDPYYSPNLSLAFERPVLAYPPRVGGWWETGAVRR